MGLLSCGSEVFQMSPAWTSTNPMNGASAASKSSRKELPPSGALPALKNRCVAKVPLPTRKKS